MKGTEHEHNFFLIERPECPINLFGHAGLFFDPDLLKNETFYFNLSWKGEPNAETKKFTGLSSEEVMQTLISLRDEADRRGILPKLVSHELLFEKPVSLRQYLRRVELPSAQKSKEALRLLRAHYPMCR